MLRKNKQAMWVLLTVGGLALSACSGAPAQSESPASTEPISGSSSAPAESTDATVKQRAKPEKPAGLLEKTDQGLEAAARYWVDVANYAVATGDTSALKEFSDDDCSLCDELASEIEDRYASGGRIEGNEFTVAEVSAMMDQWGEEDGDKKFTVAYFKLERNAGKILDASGKTTAHVEALSCKEVEANWDEVAYDKDGKFIGSICSLVVQEPKFDDSEGWKPLDVMTNPQ